MDEYKQEGYNMLLKKNKFKNFFIALLLLLFDQIIKIIVFYSFPYNVNNPQNSILSIRAIFNNYGNFINAKWQLGYHPYFYIALNVIMILLFIWAYDFIRTKLDSNKIYDFLWCLLIAGTFASLFDKIFWSYTLDFISIRNFAVFDIKDLYYTIGIIGFIILIFYSELKETMNHT